MTKLTRFNSILFICFSARGFLLESYNLVYHNCWSRV